MRFLRLEEMSWQQLPLVLRTVPKRTTALTVPTVAEETQRWAQGKVCALGQA